MNFQKKNIKNICSLYASDWHLAVMLLPYLSKKLEKNEMVETILKEDIKENVQGLVSRWNINKPLKEKILDINWNISKIGNKEEVELYINRILTKKKNTTIILNGKNSDVKEISEKINDILLENYKILEENNIQITIINFFKALELEENLSNKYEYVLNTSGEHKIG